MELIFGVFVLVAACGKDDDPPVCSQGQQIECTCLSGAKSMQTCKADGSGFDACACGNDSAAGSGGSSAGGSAGSGPACNDKAQECITTPCCAPFACGPSMFCQ